MLDVLWKVNVLRLTCSSLRYDYVLAREYNWNVKNKLSKGYEETYFFVVREDGIYYNELETRYVPDTFPDWFLTSSSIPK